jgi:hypothetical protein
MSCPISGFQDPDFAATNSFEGQEQIAAEDPRAMIAVARVNWLHSHYKIVRFNTFMLQELLISDGLVFAVE